MKKRFLILLAALLLAGCTQAVPALGTEETTPQTAVPETTVPQPPAETEPPRDVLREKLDAMTLEEKVGQMFLGRCRWETGAEDIEAYHLGGFLLFGRDFDDQTPESLRARLDSYQNAANIPMLLAVDEEGGTVCRVSSHTAFREEKFPSPREAYASGGMEMVLAMEWEKGYLLHSLGLNVNLAPVCDISQTPGAFLYNRSLGADPVTTGQFVAGTLERLAENGIGGVMKHFPGYGSATVDDHNGTSVVEKTLSELEACDLVPFQTIIASEGSVPFVMVSHLSYPNVTGSDTPADLSSSIVTDILRDKLEYQNVIITDSHSMASITDHYSEGEAAVKALASGCDMILMPSDLQAAFDAVKAAVADGTLSQARIDESVLRILTVKAEYGIIS